MVDLKPTALGMGDGLEFFQRIEPQAVQPLAFVAEIGGWQFGCHWIID